MSRGLGAAQREILDKVVDWQYWGISVSQLNRYTYYHKASVSRAIRTLERGGYILKEVDADGVTQIKPTSRGLGQWAINQQMRELNGK